MEAGSWTVAKDSMEELDKFLYVVIPGIGNAYRTLIEAYDNPVGSAGYRDRGYNEAKHLLDLFSVTPNKEYEDLSGISVVEEEESGYFPELVKLTSVLSPHSKATDTHLSILKRLRDTYLEPIRELNYKTVPESMEERDGRLVFSPDEFVLNAEGINAILTFMEYLKGRTYLDVGYFVEGIPVKDLVNRFMPSLDAFGRRWKYGQHWKLYRGKAGVDQFGVITLGIVDSLAGSTMARSLESNNADEVLLTYVPNPGIDSAIFRNRRRLRNRMREDLLAGTQRNTMCNANMIRGRGKVGNFLKYLKRVKKASKFRERKNPLAV